MFTVNQILNALRDSGPDGAEVRVASAWTVQKVANGDVPGITDDWIRKNLRDALSKWLERQRHQATAREVTYPRRWEQMPPDKVTSSAFVLSNWDRWIIADALEYVLEDSENRENHNACAHLSYFSRRAVWRQSADCRSYCRRLINFLAPDDWKVASDWPR